MLKKILADIVYLSSKKNSICSFGSGHGRSSRSRPELLKQVYRYEINKLYNITWGHYLGRYTICIKSYTVANEPKYLVEIIRGPDSIGKKYDINETDIIDAELLGDCAPLGSVIATASAMPTVGQKRKTTPLDNVNSRIVSGVSRVSGDYIRYDKSKFPETGWPSIGTYVINNKGYIGTVINNTFIDEIIDISGNVVQEPNITIYWDFRSEFLEENKPVIKLGPSPCSGLPVENCNNDCIWTKKGCQRKRRVKIPLADISAQDDLTNDECVAQGIKIYTKYLIDKNLDIINIIPPIGIYLEILSQLDALKDFCEDKIIITDEHKLKQANIIKNNIMKICENLKEEDQVLKDLLKNKGTLAQIYTELEKKLGLVVLFPFDIINILFPGLTDTDLISNKFILNSYLLHYLNNEKNINELKILSNNYKKIYKSDSNLVNENLINNIKEWFKKGIKPKTIAWVEATPGAQKIIETLQYLNFIAEEGKLLSFISPATKLDAAPESNEITTILEKIFKSLNLDMDQKQGFFKSLNLDIGQKQNIILKDTRGEILIDWVIERIDNIEDKPKYLLHIEKFFTLNCKKFGGLKVVNTKLSIQNVWNIIRDRLIDDENADNHPNPYNDNKELYEEADLCIKANKTSMDMLKGIYAMHILNEHSKLDDNIDMISIFNDQNAARFFSSISSNGVTIYASKVPFEPDNVNVTPTRFIIKQEIISFLSDGVVVESETSLHPDLDETTKGLEQIGENESDAESKPKYILLTHDGLLNILGTDSENIENDLKKYFSTINPYSFEIMYKSWNEILNEKNDNFDTDFNNFKKWYDSTQKRQSFGKIKKDKKNNILMKKINKDINYLKVLKVK